METLRHWTLIFQRYHCFGCWLYTAKHTTVTLDLPEADLSSTDLDFGDVAWGENTRQVILTNLDLPMGIDQISLVEDGMQTALFTNQNSIACPENDSEAARTDASVDTWDDPNPGNGGGNEPDTEAPVDEVVILDPDCSLTINVGFSPASVGAVHGSIEVLTISEQEYEDEPSYHRDPDGFRKVISIVGNGIKGVGNIVVRSPTVDMGHHYTGESHVNIHVHNVGDGDFPWENRHCRRTAMNFSVNAASYDSDRILPAACFLMELVFAPTDLDPVHLGYSV